MTEYITATEAAAMLKAALRTAFPGVRFSVRKDRGTASAWLNVSYTDGPTERRVQEIADRYAGRQFNGRTYVVDGVIVSRTMGPEGRAGVAARVVSIAPGLEALDHDGNLTTATLTPEQAVELAGANYAHGIATVRDVARQVFRTLDMSAA